MPKTVWLAQEAFIDPLENNIYAAFGYGVVGFFNDEETAYAWVKEGGMLSTKDCWAIGSEGAPKRQVIQISEITPVRLEAPLPPDPETPEHMKPIIQKMETGDPLTPEELLALIQWECDLGGITLEQAREIRRTRIYPPGKHTVLVSDAVMLLGMLED
jgi:hypothetical protein